jgi:O-antigen ligase
MLAFGGAWLASAFVAQDRSEALNQVIDFAKDFVILLCVVYSLEARPTSWKRAVWLIILTAAALAGLGTYQVLTGDTGHTFFGFSKFIQAQIVQNVDDARLVGPIDDPNFYGQALAAVLPLAIYRLLDERRLGLKLVAGMASLLLVFAVINTYSRGAFVATVLVLIFIALERRVNFSLLLLVAVAALAIIPFLPSRFTDRLETLSIFTRDDATLYSEISFRGRASEMLAGVNMFVDHPFLGVGIGNYPLNYQDYAGRLGLEYRSEEREAHSLYLEIAAETGLFGIFTFAGLFASLLVGLTQARKKLNRLGKKFESWNTWITSLQLSVAAYFTSSIFLHGDYIRYLWLLVALGVAMIHLADSLEKKVQVNLALEAHR